MRRALRGGWAGVVLGAAMVGLTTWTARPRRSRPSADSRRPSTAGSPPPGTGTGRAAADAYSEAIRLDPASVDALRRRGSAYLHLGENDRALADLDAAARLAPGDAASVYNRGLARARLGDNAGALADFSEAIRLDPGLARAYQARAVMHARREEMAEAEADWRRAAGWTRP